MTHRASYWKTTAISFAGAGVCLLALAWASSSSLPRAPFALLCFVFGAGFVACLLVTVGGIVSLWRDAREAAGKEDLLARSARKAATPGLITRCGLRFLLGSRLRPGDLVQVKPRHEIEATLDGPETTAGLPFMAEMELYCDRVMRVHRRVDHINDMRNKTGLRRMHDMVTLTGVRCSGSAHGGCQAECQLLWKDAWLKRLPARPRVAFTDEPGRSAPLPDSSPGSDQGEQTYFCQMTALWEASRPLSSIDVGLYLRPLLSGNNRPGDFLMAIFTQMFNVVQKLRGGIGYPCMPQYALKGPSPSTDLHLDAGDIVAVRSKEEISRTLIDGRNRGLWFDREMIRFCGQAAVVRKRVSRIIHERTGKMIVMKTPCVMLEDVIATGEFLRLCPQHEYLFWREIWLKPVQQDEPAASAGS